MNTPNVFPAYAMTETQSEQSVKLEGQRVVFDKKVSLLPADIRKEEPVKLKSANGKPARQYAS